MNEQLKALLETLELSEDTATQIQAVLTEALAAAKAEGVEEATATLTEAHAEEVAFLKEKANEYGAYLKEKANEYGDYLKGKANEYGESIKESVSGKMKEYADYAIEEFIAENKERFVETEEYSRMKSAFSYIKEAFEKNAFSVQEDVAVTELQESLKEATAQYESLFEDLSLAREELEQAKRTLLLERATADLADTQKEKVNELLEAVSFDSTEEYETGLAMIVEQAKAATATEVDTGTQAIDGVLNEDVKPATPAKKTSSVDRFIGRGLL